MDLQEFFYYYILLHYFLNNTQNLLSARQAIPSMVIRKRYLKDKTKFTFISQMFMSLVSTYVPKVLYMQFLHKIFHIFPKTVRFR